MEEKEIQYVRLYVGGEERAFRCTCGSDLFKVIGYLKYECHGCWKKYQGDGFSGYR